MISREAKEKKAQKRLRQMITDFIHTAYEAARKKDRFNPIFRKCPGMEDEELYLFCVFRAMGRFESGRAFLQDLSLRYNTAVPRSSFFEALQSKRRTAVISKISAEAFKMFEQSSFESGGADFLKAFPELNDYAVFNGDGHYISHSAHVVPEKGKKKHAAGSIYIQSLRTGNLFPFCAVRDGHGKKHEMPCFRREVEKLPSSFYGYSKILWVLDMAYVDNRWWGYQRKRGHYTISRLKSNARPIKCGQIPYDRGDPINKGVTDSYYAGMNCGWIFRVVEYTDPETGEEYTFVTNLDEDFRPGLIAWLYFKRWNIEKNFDTTKNTMEEKKAWGNGKGALSIQSHAIAFAYNIMRLFHETIAKEQKEQGNRETLSERKYRKALAKRREKAVREGREVHPMLSAERMARIPSAFVRCFRMCFFDNVSLSRTWGLLTDVLYCQL